MKKIQIRNAAIMLVLSIALVFAIGVVTAKEVITYKDGEYYDVAKGNDEGIWAKVEIKDGKIASVEIVENHETVGICEPAINQLPAKIVEKNSPYVDSVSGATKTSTGIKDAVLGCLDQAAGKKELVSYTPPAPKPQPTPLTCTYKPGKYTGSAEGFEELIQVEVEFSETAIVSVKVLNSEDGEERVKMANEVVPGSIIKWQTYKVNWDEYDVDAAAGATWTSKGIMEAVAQCVEQAKK